MLGFVIVVI